MTGPVEDMFLRFEGLSDNDIATLNARLADIQNLITVAASHRPQFDRVVRDLTPIIQKFLSKQRELK